MNISDNVIRKLLKNAYFINGTAYAGKSTMVRLLAEKHGGICCGENYHAALMDSIDAEHQPNLSYFKTMSGWQEFISRTPEQYDAWITGCSSEAAELEVILLLRLAERGKRMFVDTNISVERLREISDYGHVAVMLSPQSMSVDRFFERDDADKRFIYNQIMAAPDPSSAMENYLRCIARINSREHYDEFLNSGFFTYIRSEESTVPEALAALERHFGLSRATPPLPQTHPWKAP